MQRHVAFPSAGLTADTHADLFLPSDCRSQQSFIFSPRLAITAPECGAERAKQQREADSSRRFSRGEAVKKRS